MLIPLWWKNLDEKTKRRIKVGLGVLFGIFLGLLLTSIWMRILNGTQPSFSNSDSSVAVYDTKTDVTETSSGDNSQSQPPTGSTPPANTPNPLPTTGGATPPPPANPPPATPPPASSPPPPPPAPTPTPPPPASTTTPTPPPASPWSGFDFQPQQSPGSMGFQGSIPAAQVVLMAQWDIYTVNFCPSGNCPPDSRSLYSDGRYVMNGQTTVQMTEDERRHMIETINIADWADIETRYPSNGQTYGCMTGLSRREYRFVFNTQSGQKSLYACDHVIFNTEEPFVMLEQLYSRYH